MDPSHKAEASQKLLSQDPDHLDLLKRQVDALVEGKSAKKKEPSDSVPFSKLYSHASSGDLPFLYIGSFAAMVTGIGLPASIYLFGDAINSFTDVTQPGAIEHMLDTVKRIALIFTVVGLGMWFTSYIYFTFLLIFAQRVLRKLRLVYLKAILEQEIGWFDSINPQELASKISKETLCIEQAIGDKLGQLLMAIGFCISGIIIAFTRGWLFSLALLALFPFIAGASGMFMKVMQKGFKENMAAYSQSAGYAEQAIGAIRVVVANGQEEREMGIYNKFLGQAKKAGNRVHVLGAITHAILFFIIFGGYAYAFYIGYIFILNQWTNDVSKKAYSPGDILSCFYGVLFGMFSVGMAAPNMKSISEGKVAGKTAFDIIERKSKIIQDDPSAKKGFKLEGKIEFKNVDFTYPARPDQQVLHNFSAIFEQGKQTALVGPSGSGKSTIVQMLERFYDPSAGQVLIDGQDLTSLNLNEFRRQVGYVGQEPVLFNETIRENLKYANPEATDEEMIEALKKANAWSFVEKNPLGLSANVGASGSQLSGGQKQRIAIARAFVKNPKILIFDEATSALDKTNEKEVQKAIDKISSELGGKVTTIVIAHRLSTIQNSDRIIVLKKGVISELGDHNSLLRDYPNGVYAKLVKDQQEQERIQQEDPNEEIASDEEVVPLTGSKLQSVVRPTHKTTIKDTMVSDRAEVSYKGMTRKEKAKMKEADLVDDPIIQNEEEMKKRFKKEGFLKKLSPHTKPKFLVVCGFFFSMVQGAIFPTLAVFIIKEIFILSQFEIYDIAGEKKTWKEQCLKWCLYMFLAACTTLFASFFQKMFFGLVGENITMAMRSNLYQAYLTKHVGWFDDRENAPGILTSALATDAQVLNGASTEGLAVVFEATFAIFVGIAIGFSYNWKIACVALVCVPFAAVGGAINAKFQTGMQNESNDNFKDANLLVGDTITNYRTVASFAHNDIILKRYQDYLLIPYQKGLKKSHWIGITFGYSQFIQFATFSALFYAASQFLRNMTAGPEAFTESQQMFVALFSMMFGAFAAGQAQQFGPDLGKAQAAASRIFTYIGTGSRINAVKQPANQNVEVTESFQGNIEFVNVWFRYPSKKNHWVFKGLNLQIKKNESLAVVGESGAGKSTLVGLLMRFYDVTHGQILIDGVDIRNYNLKQLRLKMGLVMQEPQLFNYTICENILYGYDQATNDQVYEAAKVANALEFIEDQKISQAEYCEDPIELKLRMEESRNELKEVYGEKLFEEKLAIITEMAEKSEGKFVSISNLVDQRQDDLKKTRLHQGFSVNCGLKGGKLSGGQKQRIAIARAVVRKPAILILDEATSALDENSQRLVQEALKNVMEGRTSIVIAHRLTTVERCSRLVVIEDGKVVEEGVPGDLKKKQGGYFANLSAGMRKQEEMMNTKQ